MDDKQLFARITLDLQILGGRPVVTGTRIGVEHILNLLTHRATLDEIFDEYQGLTLADIQACLLFAAKEDKTASSQETAYLMRSSKNAKRLFAALERAQRAMNAKPADAD